MPEYTQQGDALRAAKVMAKARQIGPHILLPGSGKHQIQQVTLRDSVYCVIAIPLRAIQHKRSSSPTDKHPNR
jgi:hypothetical protein